ncbi:MAG: (d)CMP kinase [Ruthenibacterium sp.]
MTAIAIDGPSGAGKSTLARRLAAELGYVYVDTGAMYRAIGLYAVRQGVDPKNEAGVVALLPQIKLDLCYADGVQHILLNGEDVSLPIRAEQISMAASGVSAHPAVREFLLASQRDLAKTSDVIMDGRDIGTVVLPDAQVKIFLTASPAAGAKPPRDERFARGEAGSYAAGLGDVVQRAYNDTHRAAAPLKAAQDAVLVDTTQCDFEQSFRLLLSTIQSKRNGGK